MKKQAFNPYLPSWEYIPDGEPYVFGDRVYVYGSHDQFNGWVFCQGDYMGWSAPVNDLSDWRCEGVIYPRDADPVNADGHMCLYAPDVTRGPDGRYYLYYVYDKVGFVSVAVCDSPAGMFKFLGYVHYKDGTRLGDRPGDEPQFDPGVLTEGDKTFLYTGFCGHGDKSRHGAYCTVLGPDMVTVEEEPVLAAPGAMYAQGTGFEGHAFFEASSIRKRNGTYYFVYSSQVMHELCYATASDPRGPFAYGGVIVSNNDIGIGSYKPADRPMAFGGNNHGSIVEIAGQWYIFYHRQTNGHWFSRQGCAEPIFFDENGGIKQAEITSCGLNGGPLRGEGEYPAYIACHIFMEKDQPLYIGEPGYPRVTQDGRDGDKIPGHIADIGDGVTVGFKYFDCRGVRRIAIQTRAYCNGVFQIKSAPFGEVLGEIPVQGTNVWTRGEAAVDFPDGKQALYLTYRGTGKAQLKCVSLEK
ncbi:MAG: family 43 glycosylhydrolase [Clostridiales bacterium]|nr:family 43 glycosylhydrolase [Clostridiales bacterium]